jgi:putative nucleotidyltransferase with HDIG domain
VPAIKFTRRGFFLGLIFVLFCGFILLAVLFPILQDLTSTPLAVGDVAPYNILAPTSLTFESQILTARQQDTAAAAVPAVYSSPDTSIARQQLEQLRNALAYINNVRADSYATTEQKITDLSALEHTQLSRDTIVAILSLSSSGWSGVSQEAISVLDQVMREPIRDDQVTAIDQKIPTLVSLSFPQDQSDIITELVQAFVIPNSLYNAQLTEAARQQARDNVAPVTRSFRANEIVVQSGKVITVTDFEALQQFGLAQPKNRWQDILSSVGLTVITVAIFIFYYRRNSQLFSGNAGLRRMTLIVTLFLLFLLIARIFIPGHAVIPYVYPVMGYALVIAALFSAELAFVTVIPLAYLIPYGLPEAQILTLYYLLASLFGVFMLRKAQRLTSFFWAGAAIAISGALVSIVYRITEPSADWVGLATLALAAIINGIASASIALLFHYYLAPLLGKTTRLQLIELSRPDHPLQQLLLRNAPGTYQHSLQLANLVEQAADTIGADAMLARVGALYHDIGKLLNPFFFIENQPQGNINPHNDLDPETSASTIIRHVTDGLELGRKYHLPKQLLDFIAQHHGTTLTRYQYGRALELAGMNKDGVDLDKFRYPGPRPSSREIALLMLADTCEARMRAERPKDEAGLQEMIKSVVKDKLELGELDDTQLTLKDLDMIIQSFTSTLRGVYHPRIQYPRSETDVKTRPAPYRIPDADTPPTMPDFDNPPPTENPHQV